MGSVNNIKVPKTALLNSYAERADCYTDCYCLDVSKPVDLEGFIFKFFSTPVFRLERAILGLVLSRGSSGHDVERFAAGKSNELAIWQVEDRKQDQLIMKVGNSPIRSWLMVGPVAGDDTKTRLYFGTCVVLKQSETTGEFEMEPSFRFFLRFHKLYSRLLLKLASR